MKKSAVWTMLVPVLVFSVLLIGIFIGRLTSGVSIQPQKLGTAEESVSDVIVDGKIDINAASQAILAELPGIGTVLAQRIVEYRQSHGQFTDISELLNVNGIGEVKLNGIMQYVTVGGK